MRIRLIPAALAVLCLLGSADARPGRGTSMGSRGSRSWSAPPRTPLTPSWTRPMDRSMTPSPGYGRPAASPPMRPYQQPFARSSFMARHPFMTGFAGGLIGAGIFGLLSGHGLFAGVHGIFSLFGFLFQILLVAGLIALVIRLWRRPAASPALFRGRGGQASAAPVALTTQDYKEFETLLLNVQAAWSAQNMRALTAMATPEMAGYFSEQLSDLASRGARNIVSDVRFLNGELSEAWREDNIAYATVAMRYSLIDITTDINGTLVEGSDQPVTVTELWTFLRSDGSANWVLSAIQQAG